MSPLWALAVILGIVLVLFVVVPYFMSNDRVPVVTHRIKTSATQVTDPTQHSSSRMDAHLADPGITQEQPCVDREMLKSFYPPPLKAQVPVDYPRKAIGACPYSKAQSTSLPPADIPMCVAAASASP